MTTGTLTGHETYGRAEVERRDSVSRLRLGRVGLGTAGVVAVLAAAWGGIVPFVGPLFGFSADGAGSWHWNLAHLLLAVVPGAVGVLLGLFVIAESRGVVVGKGRLSLATAGTLLILCGAWFAIGPYAWPVVTTSGTYFTSATHLRFLTYELGYSVGVGLVLVMCGGFVAGWASRHSPRSAVAAEPAYAAPAADPAYAAPAGERAPAAPASERATAEPASATPAAEPAGATPAAEPASATPAAERAPATPAAQRERDPEAEI
jgi:hypothetical protein